MSYSIVVNAPSKREAKAALSEKLDSVEAQQPAHKADRAAAQKAAGILIDALQDDSDRDVQVTVHASSSGTDDGPTDLNLNLRAELIARPESDEETTTR